MTLFDLKTVLLGVQAFLFFTLLIKLLRTRKQKILLQREIQLNNAQFNKIREENSALTRQIKQLKDFHKNLKEAELTTRFQHPRLSEAIKTVEPGCPERYQYIRSLDQTGMSCKEISTTLNISPQETEQLLALSRIAQKD